MYSFPNTFYFRFKLNWNQPPAWFSQVWMSTFFYIIIFLKSYRFLLSETSCFICCLWIKELHSCPKNQLCFRLVGMYLVVLIVIRDMKRKTHLDYWICHPLINSPTRFSFSCIFVTILMPREQLISKTECFAFVFLTVQHNNIWLVVSEHSSLFF